MSLPGDLGTCVLTGTFTDPAGNPMRGTVTITPNATLLDATGNVIVSQIPRAYQLFNGSFRTAPLVGTDNTDISPSGWTYLITIALQEVPSYQFNVALPSSGSPVDLSTLSPAQSIPELAGSVPVTGGTVTGKLTLTGSTPLQIPAGAAAGDVLTSDSSGNAAWGPAAASALTPAAVVNHAASPYSAAATQLVPVDTTSGNVTVTLPGAPANLTVIGVKHVIQGGTNTVTVACGGSDVLNKTGGGTSLTLTLLNQGVLLQYKASGGIWYVTGDDLPLAQLDNRYPDVFNVKGYGATGNGSIADDTAIQAAIAAAVSAGGGVVFLPRGTYKLTTGLTMHSSVTIRGAGALVSVLEPASGVTAITAAGSSGSQITQTVYEDFGITGPGQGVGSAPGISITWCTTGTRFSRLYIQLLGGDGIIASNSYTVSVRDCFLASNGANGLNAQNNINSWAMAGNTALLNTQWGYYIMGGAAGVMHACDAESNGYGGAAILGTFSFTVEGGEYENNGSSGSGQQCGIYVGRGTIPYGPAQNTTVRGNWVQGTSVADYGIVVDGATLTELDSNGFQNNLTNHISVTSNATATIIRQGNYFSTPGSGNIADAGTSTQMLDYDSTNAVMRASGFSFGPVGSAADVTMTRAGAGRLVISGASPSFGAVLRVTNTSTGVTVPALYMTATASTDLTYGCAYTGNAFLPFQVQASGRHQWGSGSAGQDTAIARSAAGVLSVTSALGVTGLTGAATTTRWVGSTASGIPASGTFSTGDWISTQAGRMAICTAGGSPGTWTFTTSLADAGVKTGAYSAVAGDFVPCDTATTGSFTVTLPTTPADRSRVAVKMIAQSGTRSVTVACGGSDVINKAAGSTSLSLSLLGQGVILQYTASTGIWYVQADDLPLSQLDTRYALAGSGGATTGQILALSRNCAQM